MSECIEFPGRKAKGGYGVLGWGGKNVKAHRLAFFRLHGWWPPVVRHTCDNPPCWNQAHLIAGTQADNIRDMHERGRFRHPRGATTGRAKLTDSLVLEMRALYAEGVPYVELGRRYGVTRTAARRAVLGITYSHIEEVE